MKQATRIVTVTCDLCEGTPATTVTLAVNGLPKTQDGSKRPKRRTGIDLCGSCAERFDLGVTQYLDDVREGVVPLPEIGSERARDDEGEEGPFYDQAEEESAEVVEAEDQSPQVSGQRRKLA